MTEKPAARPDECKQKKATIASENPLLYTLAVQLLVVLPVSAIFGLVDKLWLKSFLLGAAVYIVPNVYFTLYAFRYQGSANSQFIVRAFFTGESGKYALAAVGFALVFRFVSPLHPPTLMAGFISLVALQWFIGYQVAKNQKI